MPPERIAILFDIDGTLISTGGAGAASWRLAFDELYGIPADIGKFTDAGMTDPEVGRRTFVAVIGHEPTRKERAAFLVGFAMQRKVLYGAAFDVVRLSAKVDLTSPAELSCVNSPD